ncbi:MAG: L,D-transpeptidase [Varibaculum sp.]|nr:L,D-transpeptidase [Varibaculum sp.]
MSNTRKAVISIVAILVTLVVAAGAYIGYFAGGKHALPGSKVGAVKVTGMTRPQIQAQLEKAVKNSKVDISGKDVQASKASLADMGMKIDAVAVSKQVLEANSDWTKYITAPFVGNQVKVPVETDNEKLYKYTQMLTGNSSKTKAPIEPSIITQDGVFVTKPGVEGRGVSPKKLQTAAQNLVDTQKSVKLTAVIENTKPMLSESDLADYAETANKLIKPEIKLQVGKDTLTVPASAKAAWVDLSGDSPKLDDKKVTEYVKKAGEPLVVEPVTGVKYVNSKGAVTLVKTEAVPAIEVINTDEITQSICKNIHSGVNTHETFETKTAEEQWEIKRVAEGAENLAYPAVEGEKWIDVNLTSKTMTAYVGADAVRGPIHIIPGYTAANSPWGADTTTIEGVNEIYLKYPSQTMQGLNPDGTKYKTPGVPSVMYFNGSYAIHGAWWWTDAQYAAGAGGSHGCVNTPVAEAKWFYDWAPIGTTVVTHK